MWINVKDGLPSPHIGDKPGATSPVHTTTTHFINERHESNKAERNWNGPVRLMDSDDDGTRTKIIIWKQRVLASGI